MSYLHTGYMRTYRVYLYMLHIPPLTCIHICAIYTCTSGYIYIHNYIICTHSVTFVLTGYILIHITSTHSHMYMYKVRSVCCIQY